MDITTVIQIGTLFGMGVGFGAVLMKLGRLLERIDIHSRDIEELEDSAACHGKSISELKGAVKDHGRRLDEHGNRITHLERAGPARGRGATA